MNELALFAGAGGGVLGSLLLGHRIVCAVEIDPYCREVLLRRQEEGFLPAFPIWDDIRTFDGRPWRGIVDVISGGFPCQPFSVAGKQRGEKDKRNMWPDTIRVIREVGPRFALLENVPALLAHEYYGTILGELAESGFDVRWRVLSAAELGAPHRRDRIWIMGNATSPRWHLAATKSRSPRAPDEERRLRQSSRASHMADAESDRWQQGRPEPEGQQGRPDVAECGTAVVDTIGARLEKQQRKPGDNEQECPATERDGSTGGWWTVEPNMGRVADGVAYRVDRLRALGNGQVPAVVRAAWLLLSGDGDVDQGDFGEMQERAEE